MPEKLIYEFTGEGKVYNGSTFIADVRFTLRTYERQVPTGPKSSGGQLTTLKRHSLEILETSRAFPMMGSALILHIGNGADKLKFFKDTKTTTKVIDTIFQ
ncbi:MAG: hypothetical protein ABSB15_00935 [Bryobacteraceae bacterium]|jgi:hypothetical protein